MSENIAHLVDCLRHRPVATTAAQMREAADEIERLIAVETNLRASYQSLSGEHCRDCCCARSWKALGVTGYTGKSIPEHITELRAALLKAVECIQVWHNMGMSGKQATQMWDIYWRNAPEMKPIREALAANSEAPR